MISRTIYSYFQTYAKTGVIFRELRKLLDELLDKKLENPTLNLLGKYL